jgi:hypothetical protein
MLALLFRMLPASTISRAQWSWLQADHRVIAGMLQELVEVSGAAKVIVMLPVPRYVKEGCCSNSSQLRRRVNSIVEEVNSRRGRRGGPGGGQRGGVGHGGFRGSGWNLARRDSSSSSQGWSGNGGQGGNSYYGSGSRRYNPY